MENSEKFLEKVGIQHLSEFHGSKGAEMYLKIQGSAHPSLHTKVLSSGSHWDHPKQHLGHEHSDSVCRRQASKQLPWPKILKLVVKPVNIKLKLWLVSSKAYTGPSESACEFQFINFLLELLHPQQGLYLGATG